ncbi:MAG: hypothetical protein Q8O67_30520 [Deltaproteobacteria bacterium]|nr:hypothetical protein [Deltaproteobacteria bacterium]
MRTIIPWATLAFVLSGLAACEDDNEDNDSNNSVNVDDDNDNDIDDDGDDDDVDGSNDGVLPQALQSRLSELSDCQGRLEETDATYPPQEIRGADGEAFLHGYYLIDSANLKNPFTSQEAGFNEQCGLAIDEPIGTIRAVIEPNSDGVVDAADPHSRVELFTDVCGVAVINNESGWYEGWLISDVLIPEVRDADDAGRAPFGFMTQADADALLASGPDRLAGTVLTDDGLVAAADFANVVSVPVSLGSWNALQGADAHAYKQLNEHTNFTFPLYEFPATGGLTDGFARGLQYGSFDPTQASLDSRIPGSGPAGKLNNATPSGRIAFGDDPARPRDPDRTPDACTVDDASTQQETRLRGIPSGLAKEILLDVHVRLDSFEPNVKEIGRRYVTAYAVRVGALDKNNDGVLELDEIDIDGESVDQPNTRLYLAPNQFNRVVVTRELDDGLLAPRFAPALGRAAVLSGAATFLEVDPDGLPDDSDDDGVDDGIDDDVTDDLN